MNQPIAQMSIRVGNSLKNSMDGAMLGSIAANFFVSVSMKQLLKAIRVFQFLAFLVFVPVNIPALDKLFMEAVYKFSTFKVIPAEFMKDAFEFLGVG